MRKTDSGGKHLRDDGVELLGAREVVAERLLDDNPAPGPGAVLCEAVLLQLTDHVGEEARRDRQVERVVAARAALAVEILDGVARAGRTRRRRRSPRHKAEALRQLLPYLFAEGGACVLLTASCTILREVLVCPVATGEPDEREAWRQQTSVGKVVDRRHQLLARQVAGDAEDDEAARASDVREPPVLRIAERVGRAPHAVIATARSAGRCGAGRSRVDEAQACHGRRGRWRLRRLARRSASGT